MKWKQASGLIGHSRKGNLKRLLAAALVGIMLTGNIVPVQAATVKDVFDAKYYADTYNDVKQSVGNNEQALYRHYSTVGKAEGRNMSELIDIAKYRAAYPDLNAAFGNNYDAYVNHYIEFGFYEGRKSFGTFDARAYADRYPDLKQAFGYDVLALYRHYMDYGRAEGRNGAPVQMAAPRINAAGTSYSGTGSNDSGSSKGSSSSGSSDTGSSGSSDAGSSGSGNNGSSGSGDEGSSGSGDEGSSGSGNEGSSGSGNEGSSGSGNEGSSGSGDEGSSGSGNGSSSGSEDDNSVSNTDPIRANGRLVDPETGNAVGNATIRFTMTSFESHSSVTGESGTDGDGNQTPEENTGTEDDGNQTPGEEDGSQTPEEGDGNQTPGEGDGNQTPGEEDGSQTPGEGDGNQTPGEGDGNQTPGEGDGSQTPGEEDGSQTPGEGDGSQTPGEGDGTIGDGTTGDGNQIPGEGDGTIGDGTTGDGNQIPGEGDGTTAPDDTDEGGSTVIEGDGYYEVTTDEDGYYEIPEFKPGVYSAQVTAEGYFSLTIISIYINSDAGSFTLPTFDLVSEDSDASGTASGTAVDATTGFGIAGAAVYIRENWNNRSGDVVNETTTDSAGGYNVGLARGYYTIEFVIAGYTSSFINVTSSGSMGSKDCVLSPEGNMSSDDENTDYRIVLTWGENPADLDSHLVGPDSDSGFFHVFFGNKEYGEEGRNVSLDVDDTSSYGPETITISNVRNDKTYYYSVKDFTNLSDGSSAAMSASGANVKVYKGAALLREYNVPLKQTGVIWNVFKIEGGQVIDMNGYNANEDSMYGEYSNGISAYSLEEEVKE